MLSRASRACGQRVELPRRAAWCPAGCNVARNVHILRAASCIPRGARVCKDTSRWQARVQLHQDLYCGKSVADTVRHSSSSQVSASDGKTSSAASGVAGASSVAAESKAVAPAITDKRIDDPQKIIRCGKMPNPLVQLLFTSMQLFDCRTLLAYVWPNAAPHLRFRVVAAGICLALAKASTIAVPFTFKYIADALTVDHALDTATAVTTLGVGLPLTALLTCTVTGFSAAKLPCFTRIGHCRWCRSHCRFWVC
jgi:hypothetical protein